jgi:hypothetical protein
MLSKTLFIFKTFFKFILQHIQRLPDLSELNGPHEFEVGLDGGLSGRSSWMVFLNMICGFVKRYSIF